MNRKSLKEFADYLEKKGELRRIKAQVSPELEIAEIADRMVKNNGPALLFENNGTEFPVLINTFSSDERLKLIFHGKKPEDFGAEIESFFHIISQKRKSLWDKIKLLPKLKQVASWMPAKYKGKPPCQQIVHKNPDLSILPVLKCWPYDGGRFITLPIVHTADPDTGERNVGMYRMQIFDKTTTGMHWHLHKDSASHFRKYKNVGKRMPVAVALGGDLVYTYAATAPLPENIDEYLFAGFLRNEKVRLTSCLTQPIDVPADADIVIEGYVDPEEELIEEGPFGDHTGFYSLEDYYPKFHVTCVTHRRDAVYPATIVGVPPMEDAWIGKATEKIFLAPIKLTISPDVVDLHMPAEGVFHNLLIVKIKNVYPGQAFKVMNALWGAGQMMFTKVIIVCDEQVDIHNYDEVTKAVLLNASWEKDLLVNKGPADVLDHASRKFAVHGKIGIDATDKIIHTNKKQSFSPRKNTEVAFLELFNEVQFVEGMPIMLASLDDQLSLDAIINKFNDLKKEYAAKLLLLLDKEINKKDYLTIAWIVLNNIDPDADIQVLRPSPNSELLVIDGRSKLEADKSFQRRWPNVILADEATIQKINEIWHTLNLAELITSPSIKYKSLVNNKGAERM